MVVLIKRWLTYTLVPVGIALLVVPFFSMKIVEQSVETFVIEMLPHEKSEAPKVTLDALDAHPNLQVQVGILIQQSIEWKDTTIGPRALKTVPPNEWREFSDSIGSTTFVINEVLIGGSVFDDIERMEAPANRILFLVAGAIILFMGLVEWVFLYQSVAGGRKAYVSATVVTSDLVVILLGIIFTWWFIDLLLEKYFSFRSFWGDDPIRLMGVFWVVAIVPFMTLWVSAYYPKTGKAK